MCFIFSQPIHANACICFGTQLAFIKVTNTQKGLTRLELENHIMQIIVYAGNAKSLAMESIKLARRGDLTQAEEKLKESTLNLKEAHKFHAQLLSEFASDTEQKANLFMVHGEDHMMAAITALDFAKEIIIVYERIISLEEKIEKGE